MDPSHPCLRLDVIIPLATDITLVWRTFRPADRAFLRLIIGNLPLLADSPIDWAKLCGPKFRLVRAHMRAPSHGLGVSTFPWGRATNTRDKKSPLPVYDPKVEGR
ncbi:hypothetical protein CRG98_002705 [Punica granatum]|uniref:Uncharacterized protein n=1 Tax=Punica granatum TaxID=22663 RepID=A0A2I0L889_PUNGR|nr:hypothetical protein CRG98_002705 [Punica granatum]